MASLNKVMLLGNLGKDPEIRTTTNGTRTASLSLATSESRKDKASGERKERTQWHRIVVWNEALVGVIEKHLAKGDQIFVTGQIETREWEDQGGQKRFMTEVVLRPFNSELQIIRCKAWDKSGQRDDAGSDDFGSPGPSRRAAAPGAGAGADMDDDIPF
jgi:single-strand DNA-binding protein